MNKYSDITHSWKKIPKCSNMFRYTQLCAESDVFCTLSKSYVQKVAFFAHSSVIESIISFFLPTKPLALCTGS